jgi:D-proline reductase (dithiol) PrdB
MTILDNQQDWQKIFREGWLAHYKQTGKINWDAYVRPKNHTLVSGKGIDLKRSRLMLITSAGGYLQESQQPFDASNPLGDYTIRVIPQNTPLEKLAYAHEHYDQTMIKSDPQVLVPLNHLREKVSKGKIGSLGSVVSFMGYQPDAAQLINKTIPAILKIGQEEAVDAALLVPA